MLTSSFLMLAAASFILCISCSRVSGFPFKYTLDFTQSRTKKSNGGTVGQVTEGAMALVRLFLTIDQQNVH
jgi:hypothetical protein